jgi:hypothetical protein
MRQTAPSIESTIGNLLDRTYFAKKGCKVLLQPTPQAIRVFNRSHAKKIGLFHVTC